MTIPFLRSMQDFDEKKEQPHAAVQGLTDEEAEELEFASVDRKYDHLDVRALSRAIEAALRSKNHD